jgi:predicted transposase YbfD/YdcC
MLPSPQPYFAELTDPRRETRNKLHALNDIVMIVLCAVLSGVEDWVGMEIFAREKETWLRRFLDLKQGIPSHDTLSDVMGRLDPDAFARAFAEWARASLGPLGGEVVALDGKTLRGSRDESGALHVMSAFASRARWVLAQEPVADKSNEIKAIPALLEMLDLTGAVVTTDAMGAQKETARQVAEQQADYVLALKGNHSNLHEDVRLFLDTELAHDRLAVQETVDQDHGRIETRRYALSDNVAWLEDQGQWPGLKAVGVVEARRELHEQVQVERRYFLCSLRERERFAEAVRLHWGIENQQHWVLDVQFHEDANRTRKDHRPANLALIRRTALNLLRADKIGQHSLRKRQLRAAFSDRHRERLLFGTTLT